MLPDFLKQRKTYFLMTISLGILIILGVSYGYFTRESLIGNSSNNTVNVSTISQTSQSFITTYDNASNKIVTGILNFEGTTPYTKMAKFKVQNIFNDSLDVSINWSFVNSTLIQSATSYALYECSNENIQINATEANVASTCTLVSPTSGNVLPNTGEATKLQSANDITIAANTTKYYVATISIGSANEGKYFQALIDVKDRFTHVLTINYNGGATTTTMDMKAGDTVTLSTPTKTGYTFSHWTLTENLDSSLVGSTITMGSTDTTIRAEWIANTYTITYNANGGNGGTTLQSTHTYDEPKVLTANRFWNIVATTTGVPGMVYYFKGWDTVSGGTTVRYTDGESVSNLSTANGGNTNLYAVWGNLFSYSTSYTVHYDGDVNSDGVGDWRIKILDGGNITFIKSTVIDAFLVGGGGGGSSVFYYRTGGGGGYTKTYGPITLIANVSNKVVVGAGGAAGVNGGSSSLTVNGTNYLAAGGKTGVAGSYGGAGGSGGGFYEGTGGSNGGKGGGTNGGAGQATVTGPNGETGTTREFGQTSGTLYAGGGGGGGGGGGAGGGGAGGTAGATNTGGGGGAERAGGSGIVIIRNQR